MCSRASYYIACSCQSRLSINDPPGLCKWSWLENSGSQPSRAFASLGMAHLSLMEFSLFFLCVCSVATNSLQPVLSFLIVNNLCCNRQDLRFFLASIPRTEAHRRKGLQTLLPLTHPAPCSRDCCSRFFVFSKAGDHCREFISCHRWETWREKGELLMEGREEEEISRGWGWADGPWTWQAVGSHHSQLWQLPGEAMPSQMTGWLRSLSKDSHALMRAGKRQISDLRESTAAVDTINARADCG